MAPGNRSQVSHQAEDRPNSETATVVLPDSLVSRVLISAAVHYYGLANEGLWPLCHVSFVRPVLREGDWAQYVAVNQKFADAVVEEAKTESPVVLVQDYHFALLPRLVRQRAARQTVASSLEDEVFDRPQSISELEAGHSAPPRLDVGQSCQWRAAAPCPPEGIPNAAAAAPRRVGGSLWTIVLAYSTPMP